MRGHFQLLLSDKLQSEDNSVLYLQQYCPFASELRQTDITPQVALRARGEEHNNLIHHWGQT